MRLASVLSTYPTVLGSWRLLKTMSLASSRTIVAEHRGQMRQQKQNSWTTIQLQEHHRHTSTQLQTNWLPLIQLKCMPLHQRKYIILRIKLADIVELLAISLSATIIRINEHDYMTITWLVLPHSQSRLISQFKWSNVFNSSQWSQALII